MRALRIIDPRVKLVCLALYFVLALHASTPFELGWCLAAACALAVAAHLPARDAVRAFRPLVPILVITVIMQVLYYQRGQVLVQLASLAITTEALGRAVGMLATLVSIMLASLAFMRCTNTEELMRALRWVLSPLEAAGVRVEAFMFALSVAFRFVPVLVGDFWQLKRAQQARAGAFDGTVAQRLSAYARLFAPLVSGSFRRADTVAEASVARCLSCGLRPTSLHQGKFARCDVMALVAAALFALPVFAL